MGIYAESSVNIYFDNKEDAIKVHELLSGDKFEEEMVRRFKEEGQGHYSFYDFSDNGLHEVCFMLSSCRIQNAEWQELQIIKLLKDMVLKKEIDGVNEFSTSMMSEAGGQFLESSDFGRNYSGCYSSIHDFIEKSDLKDEAEKVFGKDWEAEDDVQQIKELLDFVDDIEDGYTVGTILEKTERDKRADDYIQVTKIM